MKHRKPVIIIALVSTVLVSVSIVEARLLISNNNQRRASCESHVVALKAISETNVAGLRVVAPIPPGIDELLFKSFNLQQAQTTLSNSNRLKIIKDVNVEIVKLGRSKFCE